MGADQQFVSKNFCLNVTAEGKYQLCVDGVAVQDDDIQPVSQFSVNYHDNSTTVCINEKVVVRFSPAKQRSLLN